MEDTVSPRVLAKMVHAGNTAAGFQAASRDLWVLSGLSISAERVRRACQRVATERIEHHEHLRRAFAQKPLPEQIQGRPEDVAPPEIACVMCDGGRYQLLDRSQPSRGRSARKGEHWKESRIGLLLSLSGPAYGDDPQPDLPPELRYETLADKLTEIGHAAGAGAAAAAIEEELSPGETVGLAGPELVCRSVVASRQNWEEFGAMLASQAWYRGFAAAPRKVFVSDGSATLEKLQRTHFSHYTSVLDLLHALAYALGAARALHQDEPAVRATYHRWTTAIWRGKVAEVIDELRDSRGQLGPPPEDARSDDPRLAVHSALVYYENHAARMDYPSYRRAGLPLTSSLMESAVKQVSRRVKGTEKFWSAAGGEAILRLRGEFLSDDQPLWAHLRQRARRGTGTRAYRKKEQAVYA